MQTKLNEDAKEHAAKMGQLELKFQKENLAMQIRMAFALLVLILLIIHDF